MQSFIRLFWGKIAAHPENAMFAFMKKMTNLLPKEKTLPGRASAIEVPDKHFVNGHSMALARRSEEHTSELHHMSISYAVFCLKKKKTKKDITTPVIKKMVICHMLSIR